MPDACEDTANWREAGYTVGRIGKRRRDGHGRAWPRVSAHGKTAGFCPYKRLTRNFLRKSLASVANISHIGANETALFRLHRRTSETVCNATMHNAGFSRNAALLCRTACDPEKRLLAG